MVVHYSSLLIVVLCLCNLMFGCQILLLYFLYLFLLINAMFSMFFVLNHLHPISIHLLHWNHCLQILILLVNALLFRLHTRLYCLHYRFLIRMLLYFQVQLLLDFSCAYRLQLLTLLLQLVLYLQLAPYHICFHFLILCYLQIL